MDVRRVIRERRLQEAAEEIRRNSNSDQQGTSIPRSSRLHSARSSMPSLSQYGDAESYKIGEPEETAEWYEHDETGNQTLIFKKHLNYILDLNSRLQSQKGIEVRFDEIKNSNHFFKNKEVELNKTINQYIKEKTEIM